MNHIYLCSFASSNIQHALLRLQEQANQVNWFHRIHCYTEKQLASDFINANIDLLSYDIRGFGYWIWKPQVVLQSLMQMEDGDVLLYMDAGCHLNINGANLFHKYVEIVRNSASGFLVFGSKRGTLERQYTKGDIFTYFNITPNDWIYNSGQIHATTFFIRKDPKTVRIIEEWKELMLSHKSFIDDSASITNNALDFIENRHDQSIFSILMKRNSAHVLPITHIWSYTWLFMKKYPILGMRDVGNHSISQGYSSWQVLKDFKSYLSNRFFQ